jgi:bacterial/archaeal transporter family protein
MPWALLSLTSAVFLGLYDICQKHALRRNSVLVVLFGSTATSASVWAALLLLGRLAPAALPPALRVPSLGWLGHAQLLLKSAIVASSWLCSYAAVKHLPMSLASPIRATGPLWTLGAALLLLGERPSALQLLGIGTTLASFVGLSLVGRLEGVHFHSNRWVGYMLAGTLLGSCSGLYDKLLLGRLSLTPATVQAWFSIYLLLLFTPITLSWWRRTPPEARSVDLRWTIPLLAICLLLADFAYFSALRDPAGLISLVSSIRRGSTLIAFGAGLLLFREVNGWKKLPPVLGIVIGIVLTLLG